jgi:hypothetical protein
VVVNDQSALADVIYPAADPEAGATKVAERNLEAAIATHAERRDNGTGARDSIGGFANFPFLNGRPRTFGRLDRALWIRGQDWETLDVNLSEPISTAL